VPLLLSKPISPYSSYAVWNIKETNAQLIDLHNNSYPKDLHPTKLAEWLVTQILLQNVCQQFNIAYRGIKKIKFAEPIKKKKRRWQTFFDRQYCPNFHFTFLSNGISHDQSA
jgi:hypothetical protein